MRLTGSRNKFVAIDCNRFTRNSRERLTGFRAAMNVARRFARVCQPLIFNI